MTKVFLSLLLLSLSLLSKEISYGPSPLEQLTLETSDFNTTKGVLIFVHGGSWIHGDKGQHRRIGNFFAEQGYLSINTNYPLFPHVSIKKEVSSIARVIALVHKSYPTTPIFLMGHSSGGHLVSLVATDPSYLKAYNLNTEKALIKGVITLDGPGFNLWRAMNVLSSYASLYKNVFGEEKKTYVEMSPIYYTSKKAFYYNPDFLVLCSSSAAGECKKDALVFKKTLAYSGSTLEVAISDLNHKTIASEFGRGSVDEENLVLSFMKDRSK